MAEVMEENTNIWKVLEQCVLCDKALDKNSDPRLMPCLHSACGQCIDGNATEMMGRITNGQPRVEIVFKCKPCNQVYNPLDCIENELLFNHWSDIKPNTCQSCDQMTEVVVKCVKCNWICDRCVNAHNTYNALKQHVLEKTRVKETVMSETQHEWSQKATELLDRIREQKPLSDNSLQRLLSIERELDRQMKECYEEKIPKLVEELKQRVDTILTVKKNEFNDRRMRVKQLNDSLKFTEQFVSTILEASDGPGISNIEDMITNRVKDLFGQCSALEADYKELLGKIEVKVNKDTLLKAIEVDFGNQNDATTQPQYVELKDQGTMVDEDLLAGYRQLRKSPRLIKSENLCDKPGSNFSAVCQSKIDEQELAHEQSHPNPKRRKVVSYKEARVVCDWPGCNKIMKQKILQEHTNGVHRQVKPYICPLTDCPFATAYKGSLWNHMRNVHAQMSM